MSEHVIFNAFLGFSTEPFGGSGKLDGLGWAGLDRVGGASLWGGGRGDMWEMWEMWGFGMGMHIQHEGIGPVSLLFSPGDRGKGTIVFLKLPTPTNSNFPSLALSTSLLSPQHNSESYAHQNINIS